MQESAQALTLDGHGVVYYRAVEVPDVVSERLVREWGLSLSPAKVRDLYLSLQEEAFAETLPYEEMLHRFCQHIGGPALGKEDYVDSLIEHYSAAIKLDPDLKSVLEDLRYRGVLIGMITNSIHAATSKSEWLESNGVHELFDVIVSSVDEKCRKPDPEIYRRFCKKTSIPIERAVFVGHDSREVKGAKKAGMITVCLRCVCRDADYEIRRFREILDLPIWPMVKEGT